MAIYYYDPYAPQRQQNQFFMQMMFNAAMNAVRMKHESKKAEMARDMAMAEQGYARAERDEAGTIKDIYETGQTKEGLDVDRPAQRAKVGGVTYQRQPLEVEQIGGVPGHVVLRRGMSEKVVKLPTKEKPKPKERYLKTEVGVFEITPTGLKPAIKYPDKVTREQKYPYTKTEVREHEKFKAGLKPGDVRKKEAIIDDLRRAYGAERNLMGMLMEMKPQERKSKFLGWLRRSENEKKKGRLTDFEISNLEQDIMTDLRFPEELQSAITAARNAGANAKQLKRLIEGYKFEEAQVMR